MGARRNMAIRGDPRPCSHVGIFPDDHLLSNNHPMADGTRRANIATFTDIDPDANDRTHANLGITANPGIQSNN